MPGRRIRAAFRAIWDGWTIHCRLAPAPFAGEVSVDSACAMVMKSVGGTQ